MQNKKRNKMKFIKYFLIVFFLVITFASQSSAQWAQVTYPDMSTITCIAAKDSNLFIGGAGYSGTYLSTDNGTNWNKLNIRCWPKDIFFYGTKIYMSSWYNSLFVSSDNGNNWTDIGFPSWRWFYISLFRCNQWEKYRSFLYGILWRQTSSYYL